MSFTEVLSVMALAIAAAAIVIGAVIGLRQVAASQAGHVQAGSNTEVIKAILADAQHREEASDMRAWEFVGQSLDQLQASIIECEKGRHDDQAARVRLENRLAAQDEVMTMMGRRLEDCERDRTGLLHADDTVETPR